MDDLTVARREFVTRLWRVCHDVTESGGELKQLAEVLALIATLLEMLPGSEADDILSETASLLRADIDGARRAFVIAEELTAEGVDLPLLSERIEARLRLTTENEKGNGHASASTSPRLRLVGDGQSESGSEI